MLVAAPDRLAHRRVLDLPDVLHPGDLLVVNTSATLPARRSDAACTSPPSSTTATGSSRCAARTTTARPARRPGAVLRLPGGVDLHVRGAAPRRAGPAVAGHAAPGDRPGGVPHRARPADHATPTSTATGRWRPGRTSTPTVPGSAEMPSAGRPLSERVLVAPDGARRRRSRRSCCTPASPARSRTSRRSPSSTSCPRPPPGSSTGPGRPGAGSSRSAPPSSARWRPSPTGTGACTPRPAGPSLVLGPRPAGAGGRRAAHRAARGRGQPPRPAARGRRRPAGRPGLRRGHARTAAVPLARVRRHHAVPARSPRGPAHPGHRPDPRARRSAQVGRVVDADLAATKPPVRPLLPR